MDPKTQIATYEKQLDETHLNLHRTLVKQRQIADKTADPNARMVVLALLSESAYNYAYSLSKEVLYKLGGPLQAAHSVTQENRVIKEQIHESASKIKRLAEDNKSLRDFITRLVKEIDHLKYRVSKLESRPPPPPSSGPMGQRY